MASAASARAALAGGADRLELNRNLHLDGLTPSEDLFRDVRRAAPLPVIVMVRPHDRGYVYDEPAFDGMCETVLRFRALGADGFAAGVLREDGRVDGERLARLREAAGARDLVFHRAFDEIEEQGPALETLIEAGVDRVLTSGGRETAAAGAARIAELVERAAGRIEVLPGAGVRPENALDLLVATGCMQLHGTFRGSGEPGAGTSEETVRRLRRAVAALVA